MVKQIGWKLNEEFFKNDDGLAIENPADAGKDSIPKVEVDQKFYNVSAVKTIAVHTVEAMEEDHVFMETEVEVRCQDEIFKAKGKVVKQIGWKLYEECFKNDDGLAIENPADAGKDSIPKVEVDQKFYNVSAVKTEHFTAPPKPYSDVIFCERKEWLGIEERSSA